MRNKLAKGISLVTVTPVMAFFTVLLSFILKAPSIVKRIFMAYLLSGLFLSFVNHALKFKASGHACGVAGPITLISSTIGIKFLWLFLFMPIIYWSRINLGRHSIQELIMGTFVGIISTFLAVNIV